MNVSNIPNLLTLFRFVVTPLVILLLLTDAPWAGVVTAVLVSLAGLSDFLDGYLARYWKLETNVGKFLDPLADKVLVVAGLIMLVGLGRVHPILVVIIICREIFITGLRAIASSKGIVIAAEKSAKYKTTFQMIAEGALAVHETYLGLNGHLIGLTTIYISLGFSLYSAIEYVRLFFRQAF
ncbi:MAG: CDP-diacylglycerol--glycerol-3-phosphate 3-phosphatidyltransferase [Deltaproteobacteria bacterium]|nr:CDP-diacylglycerol--glycerol-3-phosphate 3-phosphatidyltransferase [Deltaproteobacteria bacterium]